MTKVNFSPSDFRRQVADASSLILRNRYFEKNPFLTDDGASLIARPGLKKWIDLGDGPVRGMFSSPGTFGGDLFVAANENLYRVDSDSNSTLIYSGLYNPDKGVVNMAITANIGDVPEYLFIADGRNLYVYMENGYATGLLQGAPANGDVVQIDTVYYQFTTGSVDTGSPAGTVSNPWLVALGGGGIEAFTNLADAIGASGVEGTQYSTGTVENAYVVVITYGALSLGVRSTLIGALGNSTATTETGAALTWSNGATLTGGGSPLCTVVQLPDDVGAIDVGVVNSFVIVVPAQGEGINGRFYWIEPGETTIDPLNYATAERSPDGIYGVKVLGDQFWLPGASTTEVWYVSSDATNRMQRLQGVVFDRGTWEATAVVLNEMLIICDADGAVFQITGGAPKRVSTPAIEELIRTAIQRHQASTLI